MTGLITENWPCNLKWNSKIFHLYSRGVNKIEELQSIAKYSCCCSSNYTKANFSLKNIMELFFYKYNIYIHIYIALVSIFDIRNTDFALKFIQIVPFTLLLHKQIKCLGHLLSTFSSYSYSSYSCMSAEIYIFKMKILIGKEQIMCSEPRDSLVHARRAKAKWASYFILKRLIWTVSETSSML